MEYAAAAIRNVIAEVLEGRVGTTRTVSRDPQVFLRGVFDGQGDAATKAKAAQTSAARHRFDVQLGSMRNHDATPVSATSSNRIVTIPVRIDVTTSSATKVQESKRDDLLDSIASDCDDAIQALAFPGNLATTEGSVSTNIIAGMLLGDGAVGAPRWEMGAVDWTRNLARSRITGAVIVSISQDT
jgi:hypothetical protein